MVVKGIRKTGEPSGSPFLFINGEPHCQSLASIGGKHKLLWCRSQLPERWWVAVPRELV